MDNNLKFTDNNHRSTVKEAISHNNHKICMDKMAPISLQDIIDLLPTLFFNKFNIKDKNQK